MANEAARKQLKIKEPEGLPVWLEDTGDLINNQAEYRMGIEGKQYHVMGQIYSLEQAVGGYSRIFVFDEKKSIHNRVYEMTATLDVGEMIGRSQKTIES